MPFSSVPTSLRNGVSDKVLPTGVYHGTERTHLAAPLYALPQLAPYSPLPSRGPHRRARLLATNCRKRSRKLEPATLISSVISRAKALRRTRKFQQSSQVLLDWARQASSTLHGRNDTTSHNHRINSDTEATAGSPSRTPGWLPSSQAGTSLSTMSTN